MPFPKEVLLKNISDYRVKGYYTVMVEAAEMLGADKEAAKIEMMDVLNLMLKISNVSYKISDDGTVIKSEVTSSVH